MSSDRSESVREQMLQRAAGYLTKRMYSASEIRKKLLDKGADEETADYCVNRLTELRLIDDESYAAAIIRHYTAKGYGKGRIKGELFKRGLNRDIVSLSMEEAPDEDADSVYELIMRRVKDPHDPEQIRKAASAMYRRGFSSEVINSAVRRIGDEADAY